MYYTITVLYVLIVACATWLGYLIHPVKQEIRDLEGTRELEMAPAYLIVILGTIELAASICCLSWWSIPFLVGLFFCCILMIGAGYYFVERRTISPEPG